MKSTLYLIFFSIMLSSCITNNNKNASGDNRGYIINTGDTLKEFSFVTTQGDSISSASFKGKVVMLQYTASWCGVCIKEMPFIEKEIWEVHKNNPNFLLYGIDREEPLETVVKFGKKVGISYPLVLDPEGNLFKMVAEKNAGITRNVIIGKDGRIKYLTRLFNQEEFSQMKKVINQLLEE